MDAMKEDKPSPDSSRRTKKSDVSKGAAYLARKTLVLTEEFFRERYNEAIQLNAVASIAHCHAFLFLLRAAWTKDGWMDTSVGEGLWDDDAYYAHLDDLDFD